jgi:hypothetical protein
VPHVHERVELVDREEVPDPVAQPLDDVARIVGEPLGRVAGLPTALVLQRLGQLPVIPARPGTQLGGSLAENDFSCTSSTEPLRLRVPIHRFGRACLGLRLLDRTLSALLTLHHSAFGRHVPRRWCDEQVSRFGRSLLPHVHYLPL